VVILFGGKLIWYLLTRLDPPQIQLTTPTPTTNTQHHRTHYFSSKGNNIVIIQLDHGVQRLDFRVPRTPHRGQSPA
jgi:hypothetical protein